MSAVCPLLTQIAALGLTVPITVVLDNARYQRCALAQQTAQRLNVELLFLPPYSPNLNRIERFWKFVKQQCLYSQCYEDLAGFKAAMTECVTQAPVTHREALTSLLTLKFQSFQNVNV